ncbi:class I glutamine amidotransferase-like protein [Exophiala viscosa]|uniref:Class I glutamine amidotransferase-like protein n=1 Tax=Exophiala viscosa TaxID=2486360 RepID=A0AAN6E1A1_9EURO|nr:class I glutamine amidotransferase-like protein [Exophiala viscosa]KAI1624341.1 class I glutamine amidotransferase-like protein [Exophiala viscosa]
MSAIREETNEPIQVLITMHDNMDLLDFAGPLEVLTHAQHDFNNPDTKAFDVTFVGPAEEVLTAQGVTMTAHISYKEAHKRLKEFDLLVVPGGKAMDILKNNAEPTSLVKAYSEVQAADPARERTLLAVDTAALFLAQQGILGGMGATVHPDYYIKLEKECQDAAARDMNERTDVMEERYVVNNARFDLGEDIEENPYVFKKGRKGSTARKGSLSRRESNARHENLVRRKSMKLGGMRVITSGGTVSGIDASLYLVSALVSLDVAKEVARLMQYDWVKGVVVDTIDV